MSTNLTHLVGEATVNFREILASRDIRLVRKLDDGAIVRAGKGMLEMVLQNILENAISFSPRGSSITVTLRKGRDTVELRVEDEGPGIASERIDYIFERYFSARPNQQDGGQPPHSGLGLWIVRRNVEALSGEVSATNRADGGLAISVVLPRNGD